MHSKFSTPQVSIRPNCIAIYSLPDFSNPRSDNQIHNEINLKDNDSKGLISLKASKKVRDAINWLIYLSEIKSYWNKKQKKQIRFRLSFTTLTLSANQNLTDNQIKSEFFNQILTVLRTNYKVKHYVWRAEAQTNGRIHFHIICDKFIPWSELRSKWNNIQNKAGYIDSFKEKNKHRNPNSVDVHEIVNIKNLASYLAEYCTKQTKGALYTPCIWINKKLVPCENPKDMLIENTPYYTKLRSGKKIKQKSVRIIFGKQWGLSQSLSQIKSATYKRDSWIDSEINKIKSAFAGKVVENDYVTCIYVSVKEWSKVVKGLLYNLFMQYLKFHRQKIKISIDKMKVSISSSLPPDFGWSESLVAQPIPIRINTNYKQLSLDWN